MQQIKNIVCEDFGFKPHELDLKKRNRELVECRQFCQSFAFLYSSDSLTRIGISIGGQSHAAVLYSVRQIKKLYSTDKKIRERYERLNEKLSLIYKEVDRSAEQYVIKRQISNAKYNLYLISKLPNIDKEKIQETITYLESI